MAIIELVPPASDKVSPDTRDCKLPGTVTRNNSDATISPPAKTAGKGPDGILYFFHPQH